MHNTIQIEHIWAEYQSALKGFLHAKISNADDVDDLLQEILLKTHSNLHTLRSTASIKPWLFQVANHAIIDFYRKKSKPTDLRAEDLWYEDNEVDLQRQLAKCMVPLINSLPRDNAELLTNIDIDGLSQKEHAKNMGISYSTLKSRVQKSRSQLRDLFEDCCHLSFDRHGNVLDCDSKSGRCDTC